MTHSMKNSW